MAENGDLSINQKRAINQTRMPPNHQSINLIIPLIKQTMIRLLWWRDNTKFCISGLFLNFGSPSPNLNISLTSWSPVLEGPTLHAAVVVRSSSFVGRKTLIHLEKESPTLYGRKLRFSGLAARSQNWPQRVGTKQWRRESVRNGRPDNEENSLFVAQDKEGQRRAVMMNDR